MVQRMFGVETEYAFSAIGRGGIRHLHGDTLYRFMELVRDRLPHLPCRHSEGIFLQNGSRLYVDSGGHPEMATCEVVNPWDACLYVQAGDRILGELAEIFSQQDSTIERVIITRCNVCYSPGNTTTWGSHESYAHRADPSELRRELMPHLISRLIYTGAGGFNNRAPGLEFMLSPRVAHLEAAVSDSSTHNRGIFHTKDEPLNSEGYHRLHVICGESVCSTTALFLKVAVTAAVVALVEAGLRPCQAIRIKDPLGAMRLFAADTRCAAEVPAKDGRMWSALQIQRHILEQMESHADHPSMPAWTSAVCTALGNVLDCLERGANGVARTLDWAIKLSLFQEYARRRGIDWQSLGSWNKILTSLNAALRQRGQNQCLASLGADLLGANSPVADVVARLTPELQAKGLRWDSLEAILVLRHDLQKLDTRFGQLGSDGIFAALDRSGALRHGVQGVDNVKKAMSEPPADGRAHLRGECVRRFYPRQGLYFCDWSGVWDEENHRWLDLSEPFTTEEHWQADPVSDLMRLNPLCGTLRDMLSQARQSYYQGQYRAARRLLETVHTLRIELDEERRLELLRLRAWVQSRLGYLNCTEILNEISQNCQESFWLILDYISVYRFEGLVPRPEIAVWIRKAEEFLNRNPAVAPDRIAVFREYQGYYMMTEGRLEKARALLETARNAPDNASRDVRIACRASAALAEVYRRLGQTRQASELAERTATEQAQNLFEGDRAEFALPCLAKLQTDRDSSLAILRQALDIQTRLGHKMGLARTLLLQARLTPDADCAQAIKLNILDLRSRLPALAGCNLLAKIIDRWAEWTDGERSADQSGDVFWGV